MSLEKDKLFHLRRKAGLSRFSSKSADRLQSLPSLGLRRTKSKTGLVRTVAWAYGAIVLLVGGGLIYIMMDDSVTDLGGGPSSETPDVTYLDADRKDGVFSRQTFDEPQIVPDIETEIELEKNIILEKDSAEKVLGASRVQIENYPADIIPDETRPRWLRYAAAGAGGPRPKLVIVIDDLGLSYRATERIAGMQGPLTLAFLPYAENLKSQTAYVRKAGHELMVHLPMEPKRGGVMDPGPKALLGSLSGRELSERIKWNLSRFDGFVGINNHMGSSFTENSAGMLAVMNVLRERQMLFLDSVTTSRSVGVKSAASMGVPYAARDIFLDNERKYDKILTQLKKAEKIAVRRGYAIAIGHPYPQTLNVLRDWMAKDATNPVTLAPLSQIVEMLDTRRRALAENRAVSEEAR